MKMPFLRFRYITREPAQIKYLAFLMVSMIVPMLFVGGCLYFIIFNIMAEQLGIPEYVACNLFPVIKKINVIIAIGFPILIALLFVWGVILSHRFAGPMARLRREIDNITHSGNFNKRLRVRKHDDIKPLADSINRMLDKVEGKK